MDVRKCKDSAENIENKEFSCADSAPGHLLDSDRRSNRNRIKNKIIQTSTDTNYQTEEDFEVEAVRSPFLSSR